MKVVAAVEGIAESRELERALLELRCENEVIGSLSVAGRGGTSLLRAGRASHKIANDGTRSLDSGKRPQFHLIWVALKLCINATVYNTIVH